MTVMATPRPNIAPTTERTRGWRVRRAPWIAPEREPTARIEPTIPNSPAPRSKTEVDIAAVVNWLFSARQEAIPTTQKMSKRSDRLET